jgi:outer membrane lipoprotein SlyB
LSNIRSVDWLLNHLHENHNMRASIVNDQPSPADFMKRNAIFMFAGIIICGIIGYYVAGSDGRALGGGIGAALGFIVGGIVGKLPG